MCLVGAGLRSLDDPDRRAGFRRRIRGLVSQIADTDIREEYRREFDQRMDALFGSRPRGGSFRRGGPGRMPRLGATPGLKRAARPEPGAADARLLLLAAVEYPDLAMDQVETLALLRLGSLDSLRDAVLDACSSGQSVQTDTLRARLAEAGHAATLKRLDGERGPMQAALGGTEASERARTEAWTRLAAAYMERSEAQRRRDEIRARLNEEIGRDDSESVRRLVEAWRRETSRSEPS